MKTEKKIKEIPGFRNEDEERGFWEEHDSAEFVDWSGARRVVLPELKPTMKTISLRLPGTMLAQLKMLANKKDVPYQSLMKVYLSERIRRELRADAGEKTAEVYTYKTGREAEIKTKVASPKAEYRVR